MASGKDKGRDHDDRDEPPLVEAAGGVVWRHRDGEIEVLLVHRPKYDDWSLPKGKLEPGETFEEAAAREVHEETGLRCTLGIELEESHYVDAKGRPKIVRYWVMRAVEGSFERNDEVDEVRWLPVAAAIASLTYDRDRPVLEGFEQIGSGRGPASS